MNSKINEMYDLSNVDWNLCVEFATKSIVKEVCDYWNEHDDLIVNDLAKVFHFISKPTIRKYLKLGTDFGWCNYNPKIESEKQKRKVSVFKDERFLGTFDSISELSRKSQDLLGINCTINGISKVCLHKANHHKGFIFRFADGC